MIIIKYIIITVVSISDIYYDNYYFVIFVF